MDNSFLSNNDENCFLHMNATIQSKRTVRNKSTQVKAIHCKCNDKKQVKSTATQTFLTKDAVAKLITPVCFVSVSTQTEDASFLIEKDDSNLLLPSDCTISMPPDIPIDAAHNLNKLVCNNIRSDCEDSTSDSNNNDVEDNNSESEFEKTDESADEGEIILSAKEVHENKQEQIALTHNKLPNDQLKFIVFEESLVKCFERCFKCDSICAVRLESTVGTYCRISVACSGNTNHGFVWSTGPLHNRLPLLNLMISSGILSSGLECAKVLRLFHSLNIPCIKRREFTDLQSAYVIPAVVNVWNREKTSLVQEIKGTSRCIASDMRVDSPGHTGLFGSGSSLDVEKNVILDTQIIKVFQTF